MMNAYKRKQAQVWYEAMLVIFQKRLDSWKTRSPFEHQWVVRDFRQTAGLPVEEWLTAMK